MVYLPQIEDWHWEITRNCNLHCAHCIIGNKEIGQIDTESALVVVAKMASLGGKRLYVTGGEPFVRQDLRLIVGYAKANGLSVHIITNGILQEAIIAHVSDGLIDHIGISIDGNETIHDTIRGSGSYHKTVSTLKAIIKVGLPVTVYMTVNSLNIGSLSEIISDLINLGVNSFHLNEISQEGLARTNHHLNVRELSENDKLELVISQLEPLIEFGDLPIDYACTVSQRIAYVDFNGNVYSCAELAITDPESMIAPLLDSNFQESFQLYHSQIRVPDKCRYSLYGIPGLDICLNHSDSCPLRKEG